MITEETIIKGVENNKLCFFKKGTFFVAEINGPMFSETTRFIVFQSGYDRTWWCRVNICFNNEWNEIKLMSISNTTGILIKSKAITEEEGIASYIEK